MEKPYKIEDDKIIFDHNFNSDITTEILEDIKKVKKITFGANFNKTINNIPSNIVKITFINFNQKIDNLPSSITNLTFVKEFNQPLDFLPCSIKKLKFLYDFNQPLDYLPEGLEYLMLPIGYQHSIDKLPDSIKYLHIVDLYEQKEIKKLPKSLETLIISYYYDFNLPLPNKNVKVHGGFPYGYECIGSEEYDEEEKTIEKFYENYSDICNIIDYN